MNVTVAQLKARGPLIRHSELGASHKAYRLQLLWHIKVDARRII